MLDQERENWQHEAIADRNGKHSEKQREIRGARQMTDLFEWQRPGQLFKLQEFSPLPRSSSKTDCHRRILPRNANLESPAALHIQGSGGSEFTQFVGQDAR